MSGVERALGLLKTLPRVTLGNIKALPGQRLRKQNRRGQHGGRKCGRGNKGQGQRQTLSPVGYEGGSTPFHMRIPKEPYYRGVHMRREYRPFSLLQLQRLVDMDAVDVSRPIDLTSLCNTGVYSVDTQKRQFGVNLVDEGIDVFEACVNIEVQHASQEVIAAVEKNGGTIITKFYDAISLEAMNDPKEFFSKCIPIPRCKLPPMDALEYYTSASNRGYLADPALVEKERIALAQKYGYTLPKTVQNIARKDARQIWHGLQPGWLVNLTDKCILKPMDKKYIKYYNE